MGAEVGDVTGVFAQVVVLPRFGLSYCLATLKHRETLATMNTTQAERYCDTCQHRA